MSESSGKMVGIVDGVSALAVWSPFGLFLRL